MSTPCQKQICGAMHRLQNGAVLTIGPFSQLDFATAADVRLFPELPNKHEQMINIS